MKVSFIFFYVFFTFSALSAQEPVTGSTEIDSIIIDRRAGIPTADSLLRGQSVTDNVVFPKEFPKAYRKKYSDPEFDYSSVKPRESVWQQFLKKIDEILDYLFGEMNPGKAMGITGVIIRILAIGLIAFLLYFLLRFLISRYGIFYKEKNQKMIIYGTELQENIHEINFEETIRGYELQGDFRSAVRYRFLKVLKMLTDRNAIHWNPEKTNRDYVSEISDPGLRQHFTDLVYIFDNVWYGEFSIDESNYKQFRAKFDLVIH